MRPATDLGFLLHKHPDRVHEVEFSHGRGWVFYPTATEELCTAALMVEVDPIALVRGKGGGEGLLDQYVNDRPYAASSLLSTAIKRAFGTAMTGRSKERQQLADSCIPLEAHIPALACAEGEEYLHRVFVPLGYDVEIRRMPLDEKMPAWGDSHYFGLTLRAEARLQDLLTHLYVLIPALDEGKHYFVGEDEVDKLLAHGEGWLLEHPVREALVERFLKRRRGLTREALARLMDAEDPDAIAERQAAAEEELEKPVALAEERRRAVHEALMDVGARRVLDLGCGEGRLIERLLPDTRFTEIVGMDVSVYALGKAERALRLSRLPEHMRSRVKLMHSSLMYADPRLTGYDAACLVEVIEHLDTHRLAAMEQNLFGFARPNAVIVTTPNREYNPLLSPEGCAGARHQDHRFEWTRSEFGDWCASVGGRYGYSWEVRGIGPAVEGVGTPTQMCVFRRWVAE